MGKKDFFGLRVYMEDENEERIRSSRYIIDIITNNVKYDSTDIQKLEKNEITYEEVISKLFDVSKKEDPRAFYLFKSSLIYLTGDYRMSRLKHIRVLHKTIDIVELFNTEKKLHHFLAFLMQITHENSPDNYDIMMHINASFVIDYSLLLKVIELWIIDYYEADEDEVKNFLYTFFMSYEQSSFLTNCIFAHYYRILSTRVCDMIHCRYRKGTEIKKAWTDAVYSDKDHNLLHVRQVAFSQKQLDNIVDYASKNYANHPLTHELYNKFKQKLMESTLIQMYYGKDASDLTRSKKNQGDPIPIIYKYTR